MSIMEGKEIRVICDEGYPDLRKQVLERDNFMCRRCGCTDKNLDTHHIIVRRYGSSDSLDNIISYCPQRQRIIEPPRKMGPITNILFTTDRTRRIYHDSATADR